MLTEKALWVMERNAGRDLTLADIAESCGVSSFHLSHAFTAAMGKSVMRYLRGRRLSEAARALAHGAPDILGVALDAGYGSHEAFTRAFRDQFGVTPERVRREGDLSALALEQHPGRLAAPTATLAPPRLEKAPAQMLVGLCERYAPGETAGIPMQWAKFSPRMCEVSAVAPGMPYGVHMNADESGNFDYLAALRVTDFVNVSPAFTTLRIPARSYLVFAHPGHVGRIDDTYRAIWNEGLAASGHKVLDGPTLEIHLPAFDPRTGEGGVEIWIPVKA